MEGCDMTKARKVMAHSDGGDWRNAHTAELKHVVVGRDINGESVKDREREP
jgi:hypothetical protein